MKTSKVKNHFNVDLKNASPQARRAIATLLRDRISEVTNMLGGHYASPLGAVELTLAIHSVLDTAHHRIVFDTGHQSYAHKLLTGRDAIFANLRRRGGASGFPEPSESLHDPFAVGHASTSIAAVIGFDRSRNDSNWSVAVIGDAALAGGLALEAMNLVADDCRRIGIVLNDNSHSISQSVGSLDRRRPYSYRALCSAMGIEYVGPVDGHDIEEMVAKFKELFAGSRPFFLHVMTIKGKGDRNAEECPLEFHSNSGIEPKKRISTVDKSSASVVEQWLIEASRRSGHGETIQVVSPAMIDAAGLGNLNEAIADRVLDVGIAEGAAATIAAAMALGGARPYLHLYSTFMQRAVDQVIHDIGIHGAAVRLLIDRVGYSGADGPTHHGLADLATLSCLPGVEIFSVSDRETLVGVLEYSLEHDSGPIAIRFSKGSLRADIESTPALTHRVHRGGTDARIVAHGRILDECLTAATLLQRFGWDVEVVEAIRLAPTDVSLVEKIARGGVPTLVVEESYSSGSLGSGILSEVANMTKSVDILTICAPTIYVGHGTVAEQWSEAGLDADAIVAAVKRLVVRAEVDHAQSA